jgi:hypothetical protein
VCSRGQPIHHRSQLVLWSPCPSAMAAVRVQIQGGNTTADMSVSVKTWHVQEIGCLPIPYTTTAIRGGKGPKLLTTSHHITSHHITSQHITAQHSTPGSGCGTPRGMQMQTARPVGAVCHVCSCNLALASYLLCPRQSQLACLDDGCTLLKCPRAFDSLPDTGLTPPCISHTHHAHTQCWSPPAALCFQPTTTLPATLPAPHTTIVVPGTPLLLPERLETAQDRTAWYT